MIVDILLDIILDTIGIGIGSMTFVSAAKTLWNPPLYGGGFVGSFAWATGMFLIGGLNFAILIMRHTT